VEKDRKLHYAERGFSYGIENPVPLANVVCYERTEEIPIYRKKYLIFKRLVKIQEEFFDYVALTNGITRTIWLISAWCKIFSNRV